MLNVFYDLLWAILAAYQNDQKAWLTPAFFALLA
jgi:hypothetical protein